MNKALLVLLLLAVAIAVGFAFADATKQADPAEVARQLDQLNTKLDTIIQTQAKLDTIIAKQDQTMEMLRMRRLHT